MPAASALPTKAQTAKARAESLVAVARARAAQIPASPASAKTKSGGSRFVAATHLDEAQKQRIADGLAEKGIGDDMGRAIFIGALEYQLSTFGRQLVRRDALPPRQAPTEGTAQAQTLREIARHARQLADLLHALPDASKAGLTAVLTAQDRLSRAYDQRYLCDLAREIERLELASGAAGGATLAAPESRTEAPAPSRPLVAKLAKIFEECLEMAPTADVDGPFCAALTLLDETTGYAIGHAPELLAGILIGADGM